jgi:calcium permeable stress-gated cation channel
MWCVIDLQIRLRSVQLEGAVRHFQIKANYLQFLSFFTYAVKYLSVTLFFSLTVILPINFKYTGEPGWPGVFPPNSTNGTSFTFAEKEKKLKIDTDYLWMYVAFTYFFTGVAFYLLVGQTAKIIQIRQAFLGTQSTVTDRTIRLSGIPLDMRSEERITDFIEELKIGKVDSVMLCRDWRKLDDLMRERHRCLRRLEESWALHLGRHKIPRRAPASLRNESAFEEDDGNEHDQLLSAEEQAHISSYGQERPMHTIWHGFLSLQRRKIDAVDYFEEKLRKLDTRIEEARKQEYTPTPLAFVTMESTAACQMAVQAILDPTPGQMIASLAPPAAHVVWQNTYLSRNNRMLRAWSIMLVIGFLTIFWAVLLIPLAGLLSIEAIDKVLPGVADALKAHPIAQSLVQTGLPTLVFSLLSVAVPYLYDWLANLQGMTSQGDVELSVISKNFFFTFFNLFIVFTIWGSAASFYEFWQDLQNILKDTAGIAYAVAKSLEQLAPFYVNLIVLQGFGLFPFRLLEFGSVVLYPFYLITAKTPRDYAELSQAPVFSYGFYLPQTQLIFVVCVIYSVLPSSWLIQLFGLVYFLIGGFIYKYQLLYAMDHRQHSTGRAWPMICDRIIVGLVVFQIAMTGILALKSALTPSALLLPLLVATVWFTIYFRRTYYPLMMFIALRSIDRHEQMDLPTPSETPWDRDTGQGRFVDTSETTGLRYINPNLVVPLEKLWIKKGTNGGGAHNV